jgi:hypothetical protein
MILDPYVDVTCDEEDCFQEVKCFIPFRWYSYTDGEGHYEQSLVVRFLEENHHWEVRDKVDSLGDMKQHTICEKCIRTGRSEYEKEVQN